MPFDHAKDFVPLTTVTPNAIVLSVYPELPVKTLPEFIEYAKRTDPPLAC